MIKASKIPYEIPVGGIIDLGDMPALLDMVLEKADAARFAVLKQQALAMDGFMALAMDCILNNLVAARISA